MTKLPAPWRVARTRTLVRDKWIDLRADDCVRADGLEIAPYYVLDYPDWVQIVAIDEDENLVVVRQYRHGIGRVTLEIPSGCVDPTDTDPIAAGARELLEETGYASDRMRHIASFCNNPANQTNRIHLILAEKARRISGQSLDESEEIVVELLAVPEARRLALQGKFDHSAQTASLLIALESRDPA
ncbi:MAG: NUDIX hydrolase [Hyphomicrobiales bacterium]|nr:NUDIX hydrolase [Hyphomicrobiales bacterium]